MEAIESNDKPTLPVGFPFDNNTIKHAVEKWMKDREKAIEEYGYISDWNTSAVTDMRGLFAGYDDFNDNINNWDVSDVTSMERMFFNASTFNQPLSRWNVSKVTNMKSMFDGARSFNQPLAAWDVSNVTTMESMFRNASAFNQPLATLNITKVIQRRLYMSTRHCDNTLLHLYIPQSKSASRHYSGSWDVSKVTNTTRMFEKAVSFNQPLVFLDVSNVTNMSSMFCGADSFNQPLDLWNVRI